MPMDGAVDAVAQSYQHLELIRLATSGSVDDGKSTLIGRLLYDCNAIYEDQLRAALRVSKQKGMAELDFSLFTDGLAAEREQQITIDVAYRYFSTPRRRFIIADVPGHEQYTRNMVTGASTADVAMILVDARKGVVTQSKRHMFLATLLGIPHMLVVVNKMDEAGFDQAVFERIKSELIEFASRLKLSDLQFMPVSALRGDMVVHRGGCMNWYEGRTLFDYLDNIQIVGDRNLIDFRFPVQHVLRPHQDFRAFAGRIEIGIVRPGDEIAVMPTQTGELDLLQQALLERPKVKFGRRQLYERLHRRYGCFPELRGREQRGVGNDRPRGVHHGAGGAVHV